MRFIGIKPVSTAFNFKIAGLTAFNGINSGVNGNKLEIKGGKRVSLEWNRCQRRLSEEMMALTAFNRINSEVNNGI